MEPAHAKSVLQYVLHSARRRNTKEDLSVFKVTANEPLSVVKLEDDLFFEARSGDYILRKSQESALTDKYEVAVIS